MGSWLGSLLRMAKAWRKRLRSIVGRVDGWNFTQFPEEPLHDCRRGPKRRVNIARTWGGAHEKVAFASEHEKAARAQGPDGF